jgi:transcriptional regulator with XRE-family HTH domain
MEKITNLKRLRLDKKISQSKLAELSGVNVRLIQDYEQGHKQINNAMAISVYRLAEALDCTVGDLLEL